MTHTELPLRFLLTFAFCCSAFSAEPKKPKPEDVPTFELRARVTSVGGQEPAGKKFQFRYSVKSEPAAATGNEWSGWLKFGTEQIDATHAGYPAMYSRKYPVVVKLNVNGVVDPTILEAELKFSETPDNVFKMSAELFGPGLGILIWRDEQKKPLAATMTDYNKRYWKVLENSGDTSLRPKKFPIVDRFIGGDDDRRGWKEGIEQLSKAGFSAIMLPPSKHARDLLLQAGGKRTAWAVYSPPGYAFDYDPKLGPDSLEKFATKEAEPYAKAGYAPEDMSIFALSDEPGWYYPQQFEALKKKPDGLERFRAYLKAQNLKPKDLGTKVWEQIEPIGRSKAVDLPSKRLFYWSMRFFSHDSTRYFAESTRALEKAFYPNMPIFTNWNFFSGRFFVPGPVANNGEKQNPDAGMGGHDWFEFGRMRGSTMLWTEDWFGDESAFQWSFYCSKLRCAARLGGMQFGGYVIPRTAGNREDGILQKILSVTGHGGKAVKYFVFGPEYNFPGNCYSENVRVLPKMAEAHRMIAAAEDLLWPGTMARSQVAILAPRSACAWDDKKTQIPKMIQDATNNHLNRDTVDYMAEVFDIYLALQHANIPCDFIDEDDLTEAGLKPYKVLYATEPNIPAEGQRAMVSWMKNGGTLATVSGAGAYDRYDEPCKILSGATGIVEEPRERIIWQEPKKLAECAKIGDAKIFGTRTKITVSKAKVEASFADGEPAVVSREMKKGRATHFAFMPGFSYFRSSSAVKDKLPAGFSEELRKLIQLPLNFHGPVAVDLAMIETPVLTSNEGAAITILNWSGEAHERVKLSVRLDFDPKSVESVRHGKLQFAKTEGGISLELPVGAADILMLRR